MTACVIAFLLIASQQWPEDVAAFVKQREICDHLRGEDLAERANDACAGTDRQLALLKQRYRQDDAILRLLGSFEPDIEAGDFCDGLLPDALAKLLRSRYPRFTLIRRSMLHPTDAELFVREYGAGCVGATPLNFYGHQSPQYGIAVMNRDDEVVLVLIAERRGRWAIRQLDRITASVAPTLSSRRRAKFHEDLIVRWHESAEVVYGWNGSAVVKSQTAD